MTNETAVTPVQSFEEKMKAKIRDSIGDLISDEQLVKMVNTAMADLFFTPRNVTDGWTKKTLPPLMHEIVKELLEPAVREAVNAYIGENKEEVAAAIKKAISQGMGDALVHAVSSAFANDLHVFKTNLIQTLSQRTY